MYKLLSPFRVRVGGRRLAAAGKSSAARLGSLARSAHAATGRYLRGRLAPETFLRVLLPLYLLTALATTLLAAAHFPQAFDIRYRVITNLASWRDNPDGHRLFGLGLGCMTVLLIPFPGFLCRALGGSPPLRRLGHFQLWLGIVGGFVLAVESGAVAGMRDLWGAFKKAHELYAVVTFAALGFGGLAFGCCAIRTADAAACGRRTTRAFLLRACLLLMIVTTLLQLAFYLAGSVSRRGKELGETYWFLKFAFWEWMSAGSLLLLLTAITAQAHSASRDPDGCEAVTNGRYRI